jgi:hypothetical protein
MKKSAVASDRNRPDGARDCEQSPTGPIRAKVSAWKADTRRHGARQKATAIPLGVRRNPQCLLDVLLNRVTRVFLNFLGCCRSALEEILGVNFEDGL